MDAPRQIDRLPGRLSKPRSGPAWSWERAPRSHSSTPYRCADGAAVTTAFSGRAVVISGVAGALPGASGADGMSHGPEQARSPPPPRKAHRSAARALSQNGTGMRSRIAHRDIFDIDWCGPVQAANVRPPAIMAEADHPDKLPRSELQPIFPSAGNVSSSQKLACVTKPVRKPMPVSTSSAPIAFSTIGRCARSARGTPRTARPRRRRAGTECRARANRPPAAPRPSSPSPPTPRPRGSPPGSARCTASSRTRRRAPSHRRPIGRRASATVMRFPR